MKIYSVLGAVDISYSLNGRSIGSIPHIPWLQYFPYIIYSENYNVNFFLNKMQFMIKLPHYTQITPIYPNKTMNK